MKLFRRNKVKDLKKKEAELLDQMRNTKLSTKELIGKYQLPPTFRKLQELQNNGLIETQTIGFELWLDRPITPAPKDLIPFAITGGDSCYFAFITDYGNQYDLETCPIAFISPTDFNDNKPKQSNFLFAKNINDFLSLMISIEYAEHIRFQNIYKTSINNIIAEGILKFNEEQSEEEIEQKSKTKDRLIKEFDLSIINDYFKYFQSVKETRNGPNHLQTLDGINLHLESSTEMMEINGESINIYAQKFKNANRASTLVAIRNAPYKFSYSDSDYNEYKSSLIDIFEKLDLEREKRIQNFEVEMDKISGEWMKIRKQIIKDER